MTERGNQVFVGSLAGIMLLAVSLRADTVTKKNGEVLKGILVAESDADVTLQTNMGEIVIRTKIARKDIASTHRDVQAENRYCRIPLHGVVGTDIKADLISKALQQAEGFSANVVVLDIDSPGGEIAEMSQIVDLLERQNKFTTIAYVHKAMSAAAIIALTCQHVVMDTHGSIGAAVPWRFGPDGLPKDVEAKFYSAFREVARSAAQSGGHSPLLAQGMMEMNLVLSVATRENGTAEVVEGSPEGSKPLKKAGEILCLSSTDARMCGLAGDTCADVRDMRKLLGFKDWEAVGESVWPFVESRVANAKLDAEQEQESKTAVAGREKLTALLAATNARIAELTKQKEDAAKRAASLPLEYQDSLNKIDPRLTPAEHDAKTLDYRTTYQTAYTEAQNTLAKADSELQDLQKLKTAITLKLREN